MWGTKGLLSSATMVKYGYTQKEEIGSSLITSSGEEGEEEEEEEGRR